MIHKEGYKSLVIAFVVLGLIALGYSKFIGTGSTVVALLCLGLFLFLVSFFRNPARPLTMNEEVVYAPADGKVVVVELTNEEEVLHQEAMQVSIFMSPLNVHVNRNPIQGSVFFYKYHAGKFLPAWDPKSSLENERTTIGYQFKHGKIIMRQIAGALAKRIVCYAKEGQKVNQGEDIGFIKLGSRVDLFLPKTAKILVKNGDVVKGNQTKIATFS